VNGDSLVELLVGQELQPGHCESVRMNSAMIPPMKNMNEAGDAST